MPEAVSPTVLIAFFTLLVGQVATILALIINARNTRLREAAAAKEKADAIAAAAHLVDERAVRDRRWIVEDRTIMEQKVQHTADVLAAKLSADNAERAQVQSAHVERLAAAARTDQQTLVSKVDAVEVKAVAAVGELKELVKENTEISTHAFHEANGAKMLLAEEVQRRNDLQVATNAANSTHRRSTDPKP